MVFWQPADPIGFPFLLGLTYIFKTTGLRRMYFCKNGPFLSIINNTVANSITKLVATPGVRITEVTSAFFKLTLINFH